MTQETKRMYQKKEIKNNQQKSTPTRLNRLRTDSILIILIVICPVIFYSYSCFPDVKVWETYFFTFHSYYYESVYAFMWTFLQKFVVLYLMLIWFFTSKNWWNKAILVPIGMFLYQIVMMVNEEVVKKDEIKFDKFFIIPLVIGICILLILIRNKILFYSETLDLKDRIDNDINQIEKELHG